MGKRPWWVCQRLESLLIVAREAFDGETALKGVDPWELPYWRLLNAFYAWMAGRVPGSTEAMAQWEQLVKWIETPPPAAFRDARVRSAAASSWRDFQQAAAEQQ